MDLKLVKNQKQYWPLILRLRNALSENFIKQDFISEKEHESFMEHYGSNYHICLLCDNPVGFVGIVDGDIRVAVDPRNQRQGIASFMITELMKQKPNYQAKVKVGNDASRKLFENCGFKTKYYLMEQ